MMVESRGIVGVRELIKALEKTMDQEIGHEEILSVLKRDDKLMKAIFNHTAVEE